MTLFLTIPNGTVITTFLFNGSVQRLANQGVRVVLLAPAHILRELKNRFSSKNVIFEELKSWEHGALQSLTFFRARAAYAKRKNDLSLELMERYEQSIREIKGVFRKLLWTLTPAKKSVEEAALNKLHAQVPDFYSELFKKYQPDLVFLNNPFMVEEHPLMLCARRQGVKLLALTHSWDNLLTRGPMPVIPDRLVVWNTVNKEEALRMLDGLSSSDIDVVGIPLFDNYHDPEILGSREDFLSSMGLDPAKKTILFVGVTKRIAPLKVQKELIEDVAEAIRNGVLQGTQLYVRMHPKVSAPDFSEWACRHGIHLFEARGNLHFHDGWVPEVDDLALLARTVAHSDLTINVVSSICLHSAVFNVPVISPMFDGRSTMPYIRSVRRLYDYEHNIKIHEHGYLRLVRSREDYVPEIKRALDRKGHNESGRQAIIDHYIHKLDGQASRRIEEVILKELDKTKIGSRQ